MLIIQFLRQTPIGLRLAAAFGALILLLLASAAVGLLSLHASQGRLDSMYRERVVPLKQLKQIADAYAVNVIDAVNKTHSGRMSAADALKELSSAQTLIARAWKDYTGSVHSAEEDRLAADAERLFAAADADIRRARAALEALTGPATGQLGAFNGPLYDSIDPISGKIAELIDLQLRLAQEANQAAAEAHGWTNTTIVGICLASVLVAALGAWLITCSITRPLTGALDSVRGLAGGDLNVRFDSTARDELGQVLAALEHMTRQLAGTVATVRHASESVACASVQISNGNLDLSSRTEEQASALQQTSATMEQMGAAVRHNADSAEAARQLAQDAAGVATKGGEVVGQVVATMQGISDSSRKIGDIVGVIDGIAFQTNILALNAAVEAARAGEQGRGFAVVAAEVRALAHRSAQSAREIKGLIGHNVAQVEQGAGLVDDAGKTMDEIVAAIRRVSSMMAEISTATTQQSGGILQIGDAVHQMDQVTQRNAALVEESAAAAESLKHQARQLVEAVSVFKLAV